MGDRAARSTSPKSAAPMVRRRRLSACSRDSAYQSRTAGRWDRCRNLPDRDALCQRCCRRHRQCRPDDQSTDAGDLARHKVGRQLPDLRPRRMHLRRRRRPRFSRSRTRPAIAPMAPRSGLRHSCCRQHRCRPIRRKGHRKPSVRRSTMRVRWRARRLLSMSQAPIRRFSR